MLDAELLFRLRFAAHFRYFFDHRFLFSSWRKRLRVIIDHDLVAIVGNKRVERFDQMPRRAVHHRLERGVNVFCRAATPFFATRYELQLDHAFRAEIYRYNAVQILSRMRHEHADTFLQRGQNFRAPDEL